MAKAKALNMRDFIREITYEEGGAVSISIGQVGEVVRKSFRKLAKESPEVVQATLGKYKDKPKARCW